MRIYMMDRIRFNKLTWSSNHWTMRVIWSYSFLPSAVKAVVTPQDAAHTAETDGNAVLVQEMMPDHLSAALEACAENKDSCDKLITNCTRARYWARRRCRYDPATGCQPELLSGLALWSVVVRELYMLVEGVPFALPAPDSATMHAAAISDDLQR
jgi:hypothetical protein